LTLAQTILNMTVQGSMDWVWGDAFRPMG
jgi:hypothetical protein